MEITRTIRRGEGWYCGCSGTQQYPSNRSTQTVRQYHSFSTRPLWRSIVIFHKASRNNLTIISFITWTEAGMTVNTSLPFRGILSTVDWPYRGNGYWPYRGNGHWPYREVMGIRILRALWICMFWICSGYYWGKVSHTLRALAYSLQHMAVKTTSNGVFHSLDEGSRPFIGETKAPYWWGQCPLLDRPRPCLIGEAKASLSPKVSRNTHRGPSEESVFSIDSDWPLPLSWNKRRPHSIERFISNSDGKVVQILHFFLSLDSRDVPATVLKYW